MLRVCCCGPGEQEISLYCCSSLSSSRAAANADSATLSATQEAEHRLVNILTCCIFTSQRLILWETEMHGCGSGTSRSALTRLGDMDLSNESHSQALRPMPNFGYIPETFPTQIHCTDDVNKTYQIHHISSMKSTGWAKKRGHRLIILSNLNRLKCFFHWKIPS